MQRNGAPGEPLGELPDDAQLIEVVDIRELRSKRGPIALAVLAVALVAGTVVLSNQSDPGSSDVLARDVGAGVTDGVAVVLTEPDTAPTDTNLFETTVVDSTLKIGRAHV